VNVRGVNVFPAAIESVVRQFAEIREFRSTVTHQNAMRALSLDIELLPGPAEQNIDNAPLITALAQQLREALGLTIPVQIVPPGTLPHFDMKSRRFVVER
jgi:phenylacetate-CoA ligase